jgi:hypothetical protein
MATPAETAQVIRFALGGLAAQNGHHTFEHLCRHVAKRRIASNVLPATGPVSAGGDQGRDFESFRTYLVEELPFAIGFLALASRDVVVFACTIQQDKLRTKFEDDIEAICTQGMHVDQIYVFATAEVHARLRHDLQAWARDRHEVGLEIIDGFALAEWLSEPDLYWIAQQYLELPAELAPSALDDAEAREVMAKSFGLEELVAAAADVAPFSARSRAREEALDLAPRETWARRRVRLRPVVPVDRLDAVLAWMSQHDDPVVSVPAGQQPRALLRARRGSRRFPESSRQLRVLIAPMGAGKSEHASRWWDEGLAVAQADAEVEIPVWLTARQITAGLAVAVTSSIGSDPKRPCRVVIDDLDGVSPHEADRLLDEAREIVAVWPRTSVLATSRPGVSASPSEVIKVEPWPQERGVDLVCLVAGEAAQQHVWTQEMRDLLTSPLSALAVADRLLAGRDTRVSRLMLLADLARTIIERERPEATSQTWERLARLASHILDAHTQVTAASFDTEPHIWQLTDTGLVVNDDGVLRFALPVFEQHFGAQAIKAGTTQLEVAAAAASFPRWRYTIAFAVSTSEPAQAEDYLLRLARANPAAMSWTLDEIRADRPRAASLHEDTYPMAAPLWLPSPRTDEQLDLTLLRGRWLREAFQALLDGFGPCAEQLARYREGRLVQWGVQITGDWMALGEARDELPPPDLIHVTDGDLETTLASGWIRWNRFSFPKEDLGRWVWARERLKQPILDLIRRRRLSLPPDSPLARERMWVLAQRIAQIARQPDRAAIPLAELREDVADMMDKVEGSVYSVWQGGGEPTDSHDVRWMHAQLQGETAEVLESPQPAPDRANNPGTWRWQSYSPELTHAILTDVLRGAVIGYRDLVQHNLSGFGWALGLNGVLPVRIEGAVVMPEDDTDGGYSGLFYELKPDPTAPYDSPPRILLDLSTRPWREQLHSTSATLNDRRRTPFYVPAPHNIPLPTGSARAATNLAYEWLGADLQALGWLSESIRFHD